MRNGNQVRCILVLLLALLMVLPMGIGAFAEDTASGANETLILSVRWDDQKNAQIQRPNYKDFIENNTILQDADGKPITLKIDDNVKFELISNLPESYKYTISGLTDVENLTVLVPDVSNYKLITGQPTISGGSFGTTGFTYRLSSYELPDLEKYIIDPKTDKEVDSLNISDVPANGEFEYVIRTKIPDFLSYSFDDYTPRNPVALPVYEVMDTLDDNLEFVESVKILVTDKNGNEKDYTEWTEDQYGNPLTGIKVYQRDGAYVWRFDGNASKANGAYEDSTLGADVYIRFKASIAGQAKSKGLKGYVIEGTVCLQKSSGKKWSEVASWTQRSGTGTLTIAKTKKVGKGKYRAKAVFKITKGKKTETITKYSSVVVY